MYSTKKSWSSLWVFIFPSPLLPLLFWKIEITNIGMVHITDLPSDMLCTIFSFIGSFEDYKNKAMGIPPIFHHDAKTILGRLPLVCRRFRDVIKEDLSGLVFKFDWAAGLLSSPIQLATWLGRARGISGLDLEGCDAVDDIEHMSSCLPGLKRLFLPRTTTNLQPLRAAKNLEWLHLLECGEIVSVKALEDCSKLRKLRLNGCKNLASVEGLEECSQLEFLRLDDCTKAGDLHLLGGLQALEVLNLHVCKGLTSLPDLSGLEKLKVKYLPEALKPWEEQGRKAFALPTEG